MGQTRGMGSGKGSGWAAFAGCGMAGVRAEAAPATAAEAVVVEEGAVAVAAVEEQRVQAKGVTGMLGTRKHLEVAGQVVVRVAVHVVDVLGGGKGAAQEELDHPPMD